MGIIEKTQNLKAIFLMKKAFPYYKGRKFRVCTYPVELSSYWDEGSRDYYVIFDRDTGTGANIGSNHPYYEKDKPSPVFPRDMKPSEVVVSHTIFCGNDIGLRLYVRPGEEHEYL